MNEWLCKLAIDCRFGCCTVDETQKVLRDAFLRSSEYLKGGQGIAEKTGGIAAWAFTAKAYVIKCSTLKKQRFCTGDCDYCRNPHVFENRRRSAWRERYHDSIQEAERFLKSQPWGVRLLDGWHFVLRREVQKDLPPGACVFAGQRDIARQMGLMKHSNSIEAAAKKAGRTMSRLCRLGFIRVYKCGCSGTHSKRSDAYQLEVRPSWWASNKDPIK